MHVYRPYTHPRSMHRLPVPMLTTANSIGAASTSMTATVQAAGVVLGTAAAVVAIAAQAQEGSFISNGAGHASVIASAQANGISVARAVESHVGMDLTVSAAGQAFRAGEGRATATMVMTVQASGVRIVPGQQPGAQVVDMQAFIERKVERAAEYRFSGGGRTRDFYQRGH